MGLLQPAVATKRAAKIGLFGGQGAGKTVTSGLMAIGLSVTLHDRAPVAVFDTEDQSAFLLPLFDAERVPLLVVKSRSFVDMRDAHREAIASGCCAFLADSYSHPWVELNEALKARLGLTGRRLQFQHRDQLFALWGEWVREMRASPLHCLLAGRLSYEWDEVEDEAGDPRAVRMGTKMRGETDAGYEPDLLIELEAVRDSGPRDAKTRSKKSTITHTAYVLKDRGRTLNGRRVAFRDLTAYKEGDYKRVFEAFRPHFDSLHMGQDRPTATLARSSADLFSIPMGESAYESRKRRVAIAIEEIQAAIAVIWPGRDDLSKTLRTTAQSALFGARSWTAIEGLSAEALESAMAIMGAFEQATLDGEDHSSPEAVIALMQACKDRERTKAEAAVL